MNNRSGILRRAEMGKPKDKKKVEDVPLTQRLVIDEARLHIGQGIDNVGPFLANWYGYLGHPIECYVEGGVYVPTGDRDKYGNQKRIFQPNLSHVTEWKRNQTTNEWESRPHAVRPTHSLYLGSARNRAFFDKSAIAASDRPLEIRGFPELRYEDGFLVLPIEDCPMYTANEAGFVQSSHRLMVMATYADEVKGRDHQWIKLSVAIDTPKQEGIREGVIHTRVIQQHPGDRFFLEDQIARLYFR